MCDAEGKVIRFVIATLYTPRVADVANSDNFAMLCAQRDDHVFAFLEDMGAVLSKLWWLGFVDYDFSLRSVGILSARSAASVARHRVHIAEQYVKTSYGAVSTVLEAQHALSANVGFAHRGGSTVKFLNLTLTFFFSL